MPSAWRIAASKPMDWRSTDGIRNLYLATNEPIPVPSPRTALIKIKAAALNARDMIVCAHSSMYPTVAVPGLVPAADGAGVVQAVGRDSVWKIGDRVLFNPILWLDGDTPRNHDLKNLGAGDQDGTLREYAIMVDEMLIKIPSHLSYTEAAALPITAGTASHALFFGPRPINRWTTILTQGTGGVSVSALQLAAAVGATIIATSSSDEKLEDFRKLGATHFINYEKSPDWAREVLQITQGKGVDHVLDIGGWGTIKQSIEASKPGGLISLIGFMGEGQPLDIVPLLIGGGKTVHGILAFRHDMLERAIQIIAEHKIRPHIAKVFRWQDVKLAYQALAEQSFVGKIVIEVNNQTE